MLAGMVLRAIASRGIVKIGGTHAIADSNAIGDIVANDRAKFGRCRGLLGAVDLADDAQLGVIRQPDDTYITIVEDEIRILLRSICLTCTGGISDDAFDANVVGRDAAGHLAMRTILAPAIFDVGAMHANVEAVIRAAFKRHLLGIVPAWCRSDDDLDATFARLRSAVMGIACPTAIPSALCPDERTRAFLALWVHSASSLAASIAWMLCDWAGGSARTSLSDRGLAESVLLEHPPIWWFARTALRRCLVGCAPIQRGGGITTFPYHEIGEGDVVMCLPAAGCNCNVRSTTLSTCAAPCPTQAFTTLMLGTLARLLREQRVALSPAAGSSFRPMFGAVMRPERPLLVPHHVQA